MKKDNTSFEDYLRSQSPVITEFRLSIKNKTNGCIDFYIHPLGKNGESKDFKVTLNKLTNITQYLE